MKMEGPAIEAFLDPPQGPDEIGRLTKYRLLRLLGEGGMGRVYEAEDTQLQRLVALKILLPVHAGDRSLRDRFLHEARALARLAHPHIVAVYDYGLARTADGGADLPYLAMQLLVGESVESAVLRQGTLDVAETLRIARETAEGLAAAHDKGLIHRDIKPSNLWLETPDGSVRILDFGLARALSGTTPVQVSSGGMMLGTPAFMAPEQARGEAVDGRTDLFSLGCVLYTVLAGEVPFDGPSVMAVLTRLAVYDPPPLTVKVPGIAAGVSALVSRMMAKDPMDRPANAHVVIEQIRELETPPALGGKSHPAVGVIPERERPESGSPDRMTRRRLLAVAGSLGGLVGLGGLAWWLNPWSSRGSGEPIKVGILHSASGTMSGSEIPVIEMTQLALEELNDQGGLLGRKVQPILADGASSEQIFAREAERLISDEGVVALFGCWTSASRKAVKTVVEDRRNLLFYPVQYEGLEESPRIVYTGAAPNQQLLPAVHWCVDQKKKRTFFLVGSDYIFPHAANALLRHRLEERVGPNAVVGEAYAPLGGTRMRQIVETIQKTRPEVILNTVNGDNNVDFFRALQQANITPQGTLIVSFSLDEQSVRRLEPGQVAGSYTAWNYFASLPGPVNEEFKGRYHRRFGAFKAVTDPMEAAWLSVQIWAHAVRQCRRPEDIDAVLRCVGSARINAPEGPDVQVDPENHHTWKYFRIGRVTPTGEMVVIHEENTPRRPEPFPTYRSRDEWRAWLNGWYRRWNNRWSAPDEG